MFKKNITRLLIMLMLSIIYTASSYAALVQNGTVYLVADEGEQDWVTQGIDETFIHDVNSSIYISRYGDVGIGVRISGMIGRGDFNFTFANQQNDGYDRNGFPIRTFLNEGFYDDFGRYINDFKIAPTMNYGQEGRTWMDYTGWFEVFEVAYPTSNNVGVLAIDFYTYGLFGLEGTRGPGLFGSIRVNSDIPIHASPVPVPTAIWLFFSGLLGIGVFSKRN